MALTFTAFINTLEALEVSGCTVRHSKGPPVKLSTLPAQFAQFPAGERRALHKGDSTWKRLTVDLVIAVEKAGQATQPINYEASIALMDALEAALEGLGVVGSIVPDWDIGLDEVTISGQRYWAAVATVTTEG